MLRSIKQLYGEKLGALDGEIGHIKDFYFDDQCWAFRYVIVETGSWLFERQVLLAPHVFRNFAQEGKTPQVNLTRKQIEDSPSIATHLPVSRQYEEEYYDYYGLRGYWDGAGMWGVAGFPMPPPPYHIAATQKSNHSRFRNNDDPHLRSTLAVTGYHIHTSDGEIGHVVDFIIDDKDWSVRHLIVETGHWYSGKEIAISPEYIDRISYLESEVFVNVTKAAILAAPQYYSPAWAYEEAPNLAR